MDLIPISDLTPAVSTMTRTMEPDDQCTCTLVARQVKGINLSNLQTGVRVHELVLIELFWI